MKDLNCINCDTPNLVDNIEESFKCGECGEVNPGIDINTLYSDYVYLNKQYSDLADRLRVRGREDDIAKTDLADSVDHLWLNKWRNETKEKARQALEKLKEIRKIKLP